LPDITTKRGAEKRNCATISRVAAASEDFFLSAVAKAAYFQASVFRQFSSVVEQRFCNSIWVFLTKESPLQLMATARNFLNKYNRFLIFSNFADSN
jgi:hypothetical protein